MLATKRTISPNPPAQALLPKPSCRRPPAPARLPVLRPTKKATGEPSSAAAGSLAISCAMGTYSAQRPAAPRPTVATTCPSKASSTRPSTFSTTPAERWHNRVAAQWKVGWRVSVCVECSTCTWRVATRCPSAQPGACL